MSKLADQFRESRGGSNVYLISRPKKSEPGQNVASQSANVAQNKASNFKKTFPTSKLEKRCFLCNRTGYYAYECKAKQNL